MLLVLQIDENFVDLTVQRADRQANLALPNSC